MKGLYQRLISVLSAVGFITASLNGADFKEAKMNLQMDEKALLISSSELTPENIQVFAKDSEQPVFGEYLKLMGVHHSFVPTAPFIQGQTYRIEITMRDGTKTKIETVFDKKASIPPTVRISPAVSEIPANTLKLYLDFDRPMEHGDFLRHVSLQRRDGQEVTGAFRETELWSPDGKRLTLMFHPGRQKTGVNLNIDEGPVLTAGERVTLLISGQWRSADGVPLGKEGAFVLQPQAADHEQPNPSKWKLSIPKANTLQPLDLITDELFEPQIFQRAIQLQNVNGTATTEIFQLHRLLWRFTPKQPWQPGAHTITIDPLLEDLAGNNLLRPFETDVSAPTPKPRDTTLRFEIPATK